MGVCFTVVTLGCDACFCFWVDVFVACLLCFPLACCAQANTLPVLRP